MFKFILVLIYMDIQSYMDVHWCALLYDLFFVFSFMLYNGSMNHWCYMRSWNGVQYCYVLYVFYHIVSYGIVFYHVVPCCFHVVFTNISLLAIFHPNFTTTEVGTWKIFYWAIDPMTVPPAWCPLRYHADRRPRDDVGRWKSQGFETTRWIPKTQS